ncbi:peptidase M23 [Pedobacter psychrophilus]|uniref:Peptidase M23 n=1 Tax=Pedobacter psychrophilus TaxID=1826909 RepID=A0A179DMR2_9SPHI|nr:M23 family metallopeptidase [Pedobacter psychrophilus]OAQ42082.1 peptidase M23 [Pedobacter psychrophilus]
MNLLKKTLFLFSILLIHKNLIAQINSVPAISKDYFINPLDIKLYLAGSFGEIRPNHFHSGIDIKTNQREGYPVYAVADGYISRTRVQIGGFGNALYINHPNGLTSVYGHLKKFNPLIAQVVKNNQYREHSFTQDLMLTPIEIPVRKGDVIAWSGNTGGSAGPHLHFELRNTKTEETINPLSLGIEIPDHIAPHISSLYLYQTEDKPFDDLTPKQAFTIYGGNGNYNLGKNATISVNGQIGLGISTYDQFDGASNKNGLFSITIKLDDSIIYQTAISKFSFDNTRAVNAYIDYAYKLKSGITVQKGFASQNPKVKFYNTLVDDGFIKLIDNELHTVDYILKDIAGNITTLSFKLKNNPSLALKNSSKQNGIKMFCAEDNTFKNDELRLSFPKGILYNDLNFLFSESAKTSYSVSKIYKIHNKYTPVHDVYELSIKPDSALKNLDKLVIFNTVYGYQGGEFKDGYVTANPKVLGDFYLRYDSIAPTITPVNVREGVNLSTQNQIVVRIGDNLSGIKSFNGYIDGEWVLMEYDFKTGRLWHDLDKNLKSGKHTFSLLVSDNKDNKNLYSISFIR